MPSGVTLSPHIEYGIFQYQLDRDHQNDGQATTYEDPTITSPEERTTQFGRFDHLRWYGRDLIDRLQEAGFDVSVDYFTESLAVDELIRFGVTPEPIFTCRVA